MIIVVIAVVIGRRVQQYTGLAGMAVFTFVLFITSENPSKVTLFKSFNCDAIGYVRLVLDVFFLNWILPDPLYSRVI